MRKISSLFPNVKAIEARVVILCPVQSVYHFYRDFRNLPRFLGDVISIEQTGPDTSQWTIQGPLGIKTHWTIKVTEARTNQSLHYETVSSLSLRTYWEIYFSSGPNPGQTEVRQVMRVPLGRLGRAALAMIGKSPVKEVSANLHRLKQVMETGTVTDTSYSVPGKFSNQRRDRIAPDNTLRQADCNVDPEIAKLRKALAEGWVFRN